MCLKMDPVIPSTTEPAETPCIGEPVVRPRPPRERHLPAHLADYEVQLPPNLHPEPPPADSASQRPSRTSRHDLDLYLLVRFPVHHPDLIAVQNADLPDMHSPISKPPCWRKG
ncbi:hypothetical protein QQF64_002844 [Cirrhinus molitorella]|uniref:Uncharacterized protein n=1 Tax=Cirrhinus molitorella TaxID=172907 RepID=A0ABR3MRD0_9TELE